MYKKIFFSILFLQFFSSLTLADDPDFDSASVSSIESEESRVKRNLVQAQLMQTALQVAIDGFCPPQCSAIQQAINEPLLKAMLPCSSVCKLVKIMMRMAVGALDSGTPKLPPPILNK
jgi:hypothetical protein